MMDLQQALDLLEIDHHQLETAIASCSTWDQRTEAFHGVVKDARKRVQRKLHPDVCSDADALERSQMVNRVADELLTLAVRPPPPRPPRMRVVFTEWHNAGSGWHDGGTSTTTTTTTSTGAWRKL
jgi:hypothetical protein